MRIAGVSHRPTVATQLPLQAGSALPAVLDVATSLPPDVVHEAVEAVRSLPVDDVRLLEQHGIRIRVVDAPFVGDGVIGATEVVQAGGPAGAWRPYEVRVAARPGDGTPMGMVVFHEVGHAVNVLRRQDRSEQAADDYMYRVMAGEPAIADPAASGAVPAARAPHGAPAPEAAAAAGAAATGTAGGMVAGGVALALLAVALLAL